MIPYQTVQQVFCWHESNKMPSKVDVWPSKSTESSDESLDFHDVFSNENFSLLEYLAADYSDNDAYITSLSKDDKKNILLQDCMWTGCDEYCRKKHTISSSLQDFESLAVLPGRLSLNSIDDELSSDNGITETVAIHPYTPNSDHCYSQPKRIDEESDSVAVGSIDSDSPSDSSDDEVDVVTVSDECVRPMIQRYTEQIRRTPRRQSFRKPAIRKRKASTIDHTFKAAASALKRTRFQSRVTVKRRKTMNSVETSPSSSLPSSCSSSRCSSDVEDYEKRTTHNDSERKRREAQRTALQMLRSAIPTLNENVKAPKVLILNTAARLVKELEFKERQQVEIRKRELKRRKQLEKKLHSLRVRSSSFY